MTQNTFPQDEFDKLARQAGPSGVHRAPARGGKAWFAPLIAFVLAALLAYFVATYFWNRGLGDGPNSTNTLTPQVSESPSVEPSQEPSEEPEPEPEPQPTPNKAASVIVYNGSGVNGLAGRNQTKLTDAGYSSVDADNMPTSGRPNTNNVLYKSADLEATAQEVADLLGIGTITLDDSITQDVVVNLVSNPAS